MSLGSSLSIRRRFRNHCIIKGEFECLMGDADETIIESEPPIKEDSVICFPSFKNEWLIRLQEALCILKPEGAGGVRRSMSVPLLVKPRAASGYSRPSDRAARKLKPMITLPVDCGT